MSGLPVRRAALVVALALFGPSAQARQGELIERTVAIVGGAVITLSDVRTAQALALVDAPAGDTAAATTRLVERWLVLHEVARFAPPDPDGGEVERRLAVIRARAGTAETLAAILARGGYSDSRLRSWVRDDLRIAAYLDQRFAAAGAPTEADVAAYVRDHADLTGQGLSADDAARTARTRLLADRRRDLITDWMADLRRRTVVTLIDAQ